MKKILIVDDDPQATDSIVGLFDPEEFACQTANSATAAMQKLSRENFDLLLLDVNLPDQSGLELLPTLKTHHRNLPVVIFTGQVSTDSAICAMQKGAYDFLSKPFTAEKLSAVVQRALRQKSESPRQKPGTIADEKNVPGRRLDSTSRDQPPADTTGSPAMANSLPLTDKGIIGQSPEIIEIAKLIGQVAQSEASVLILGESGTGKELVARAIHQHSRRKDKPFLSVNCAALPENLLESELFGHERGAFTGAYSRKLGKFEQCHNGTIFLDEIADMSVLTQSKVLRVLQEQTFERVGGDQTIKVDVRVLAATNKSLVNCMKAGLFRVDLFYRLKVVSIYLPPLRERKSDLPILTQHFLQHYARELKKNIKDLRPEAWKAVMQYHWPGNVRELENNIHTAVVLGQDEYLTLDNFPFYTENFGLNPANGAEKKDQSLPLKIENLLETPAADKSPKPPSDYSTIFSRLIESSIEQLLSQSAGQIYQQLQAALEKAVIGVALKKLNQNQSKTAQALGLSRNTLRDRMQRFGLFGQTRQE